MAKIIFHNFIQTNEWFRTLIISRFYIDIFMYAHFMYDLYRHIHAFFDKTLTLRTSKENVTSVEPEPNAEWYVVCTFRFRVS